MKTIPPVFAKVFSEISPTGSVSNADACLPEELRDWLNDSRGIFISAPNKIITNGNYVFPLCGGYRLSKKTLNQFKNTSQELAVVVVDAKTHKSYATNLIDKNLDAEYPDNKKSEGDSNELEKLTASETFAINIYHYLPDLPKNPGNYLIYVILGDNKSNVISVEILDHE